VRAECWFLVLPAKLIVILARLNPQPSRVPSRNRAFGRAGQASSRANAEHVRSTLGTRGRLGGRAGGEDVGSDSAKRLLPQAQAAGYAGSARNFRWLVASPKAEWRRGQPRRRRPGVWAPGETLIIDCGLEAGLHVFCAVLACSRFRFVRFADNQKAGTTFALLTECFETVGGVPALVLADRMGCLKAGVVANVVVPTPEYVRFATHCGFRPDFCEAADPESKGMGEHLAGYAKREVITPQVPFDDLAAGNAAGGSPRQMKKTSPRFVQRPTLEP
jgi:hypothetical protein